MTLAYPQPDTESDAGPRCTCCNRHLYDTELDRWACRICEDQTATRLRDMPGLYRRLGDALTPGAAPSNGGRVTGATRTPPLPVALAPLNLRAPGGMTTLLVDVEDSWRRTLGWTTTPFRGSAEQTLAGVVSFLANNLPWACGMYSDVADDLRTIRQLHSHATAIVDGVREQRVPVGCCPAVDTVTGEVCGQRLKVSPWAPSIRCGECGAEWPRDQWLHLGAAIQGFPIPASAVA